MAISKVIYNNQTLIDLTSDTIVADAIMGSSKVAFKADGTQIVGRDLTGAVVYNNVNKGFLQIPATLASVSGTKLIIREG